MLRSSGKSASGCARRNRCGAPTANWRRASTQRTDELSAANASLQGSEVQLRLVADHASVFLAHLDRDHRFRFVNRSYAARYGLTPEEIVGQDLSRIIGQAGYDACRPYLEHALAGERVDFEIELPDDRIGPHWLQIIYDPERNATGEVSGIVAVITDVTARKRAEREMLRARDEAMAAARAKDDFLAALSHELRTPLSPVLLVASAAAADPKLSDRGARRLCHDCQERAARRARLIDDLLDLTRITRDKMTLELRTIDVHAVLEDALATVRAELEEKKIVLVIECAAARTIVAEADSARLQQVFWNVLKNGPWKFTPAQGRVRVETRSLTESNEMTVTITDSGIGMTSSRTGACFPGFFAGRPCRWRRLAPLWRLGARARDFADADAAARGQRPCFQPGPEPRFDLCHPDSPVGRAADRDSGRGLGGERTAGELRGTRQRASDPARGGP